MNILYIAYSCSPYHGSEDKIGWNVPYACAREHKVFVITKEEQRQSVEHFLAEHPQRNMHFYYVDIPEVYKKVFKGFWYSGRLNIWNKRALKTAREICKKENIQLIHQITPVEFRSIGDYGKIPGVKFVCGPIAGGQAVPGGLRSYIKSHALVELVRGMLNQWYRLRFRWNGKLARCSCLLFANEETKAFLQKILPPSLGWGVMPDISVDETELEDAPNKAGNMGTCKFVVVGRLVYLKGHELLLDALARLPQNADYQCRIVGEGTELEPLRKRCGEYGLDGHVTFSGALPYTEMAQVYRDADVLIMPSFREASGSVLLEAMARGLPVVTINRFGGAVILDRDTGWLYDGTTREEFIENLKDALLACITQPDEMLRRGANARIAAGRHTWQARAKEYDVIYRKLAD